MRTTQLAAAAALLSAGVAMAQQPDSAGRSRTRADSIAKAVKDSIALMKELGAAVGDTGRATPASPTGPQTGPTNPRLLPDISAVGDFVGDLSPKGTTQPDEARFSVREVELAVQAVVDPYFRGDIFLGIGDLEGVSIEQAFLTTTSLPNQLELRLGRFLMPFGKQNTTHRHDLHTIEYPYVIQQFLSDDGLKGTGIWGSRVFAPFGFYQEVQIAAVDRLGSRPEGLLPYENENKSLAGLGFSARLRNYVDLSESSNFELSFSAMTGRRAQPLDSLYSQYFQNGFNAVLARQSTLGADLTYRWRPLQQGLYKSFILQAEAMRQVNEHNPAIPGSALAFPGCPSCETAGFRKLAYAGPTRDFTGAYVFARYQTSQRSFVGSRYDYVQSPMRDGRTLNAASVYLEWFPSEFSKLVAGYEAAMPNGESVLHRLLVQATFALGPHKPHPF